MLGVAIAIGVNNAEIKEQLDQPKPRRLDRVQHIGFCDAGQDDTSGIMTEQNGISAPQFRIGAMIQRF